jgi:hypothetical protein
MKMLRIYRIIVIAIAVGILFVGISAAVGAEDKGKQYVGVITNDAVWHDTAGNEIWCNGGDMVQVADTFYWVGYETGSGRPWRINLYSSKNLTDWKFENSVIEKKGDFAKFGWAGRPAMVHCDKTDKWVILFEASCGQWVRHKVGYAACETINGEFELNNCTYPEPNQSTGDQSVYQEGDDAYLLAVVDGELGNRAEQNAAVAIYKLTDDYLGVEKKVYQSWQSDNPTFEGWVGDKTGTGSEAPHIFKRDGIYYMFTSRLWGWHSSPTMYSTAKSLEGPWTKQKILKTYLELKSAPPAWRWWWRPTLSFNTQHDFVIPVTGSKDTTYVYVGDRYSQYHHYGVGRNIFLPLIWKNGEMRLIWRQKWQINTKTGQWQSRE